MLTRKISSGKSVTTLDTRRSRNRYSPCKRVSIRSSRRIGCPYSLLMSSRRPYAGIIILTWRIGKRTRRSRGMARGARPSNVSGRSWKPTISKSYQEYFSFALEPPGCHWVASGPWSLIAGRKPNFAFRRWLMTPPKAASCPTFPRHTHASTGWTCRGTPLMRT